jgi:glycosyltransferase involved in cell wall biosynthesis
MSRTLWPPIVSVIIPCFRQAHFLRDSIESALAQTYPHVEVVVVDDGSPDQTSAVAASYPTVRCVRQRNRGLSSARNTGFMESTGSYLVFLDADDRLTPDALRLGISELTAHPECAFVAGEHCLIDELGNPMPSAPRPVVSRASYLELLKTNFIWCPGSVIYRRSVLAAVGTFDPSLRSAEDYDLYLRIARQFPIWTHRHIVAEYRFHQSAMSRNSSRMLKFAVKVLRAQRRHLNGDPDLEAACASGIEAYQTLYGVPLIHQIAIHLRGRRWRQVVPDSVVALWYYPRAFATHVFERLFRTLVWRV